jgi:hypothetical protein
LIFDLSIGSEISYPSESWTMGSGGSGPAVASASFVRPFTNDLYMPVGASRMNDERGSDSYAPSSFTKHVHRASVLQTAFNGIWSIYTPGAMGPCPRTGHFCVYDEESRQAYVGYGLTADSVPLNDLWVLDTLGMKWTQLPLTGQVESGRSGARAALIGSHLVVFGGYCEPNYFADLHTIDVKTGEVEIVQTQGLCPSARSTPIVAIYNNRYYVWGGFNGEWPSELNVLDFSTMTWTQYPQGVSGRTSVPWVIVGHELYSYGGSKSGGMVVMNLDTFVITTRQTIGAEPPSGVMGAGMVRIGNYLFFFGGRANTEWTLMYACDLKRMWWFVFHVMPDGDTVSVTDGSISDVGLFMLPRIHSFGMCYVKETRQIMAFLGHPEKDPPALFIVAVGEAFSIISLREDMLAMLKI